LATTAERAEVKFSSKSLQLVQTNVVVISPANGRPQCSQNGGRMNRTCDQHLPQTKPSRISARWLWQSWQTGGYSKFSHPEMKLFTQQ